MTVELTGELTGEPIGEQAGSGNSGPGYAKYPEHTVKIQPFAGCVAVKTAGKVIAESRGAILLTESDYSPVYYLPRADVDFSQLEEVELSTLCPFKGYARYWRTVAEENGQPVAWGYDTPYDEVETLSGYVAFYEDRITLEVADTA